MLISVAAAAALTLTTDALTGGIRGAILWATAVVTGEHSLEVAVSRGSEACTDIWLVPGPLNKDESTFAEADEQAMRRSGGINVTPRYIELTIRGTSANAIVLKSLRLIMLERRTAPTGAYVSQTCGGPSLTPRIYDVDIDDPNPRLVPRQQTESENQPAARPFPYQVSRSDAEVIRVNAVTRSCDCSWALELLYVDGERSVTRRIDDGGKPFRTLPDRAPPAGSEAVTS